MGTELGVVWGVLKQHVQIPSVWTGCELGRGRLDVSPQRPVVLRGGQGAEREGSPGRRLHVTRQGLGGRELG